MKDSKDDGDKRFVINVGLGNDNEPREIYVNANGYECRIKRGKDVAVPRAVMHALDDAVIGVPEQNEAGEIVVVDRKRFPYTVIGVAP